jgi:integrase
MREGFREIAEGWMLIDGIDDLTDRIERSADWTKANGPLEPDEQATVELMVKAQIARGMPDLIRALGMEREFGLPTDDHEDAAGGGSPPQPRRCARPAVQPRRSSRAFRQIGKMAAPAVAKSAGHRPNPGGQQNAVHHRRCQNDRDTPAMPVHVSRKRKGIWYARGSVRVGKTRVTVEEYSTGCRARADADAAAAARDAEIRQDLLDGGNGRTRNLTIADCILAYLKRPGGLHGYDRSRLAELNELHGNRPLTEAGEAWQSWLSSRGATLHATTVSRWRTTFHAAITHGCDVNGLTQPKIARVKVRKHAGERIAYLTKAEADRLIASYNPHARDVALALRYQGLRTQEALRLDWRFVDWRRRTIFIMGTAEQGVARTKSRQGRTVPMHRRVRIAFYLNWRRRGRPTSGPVFLSSRGKPYADTRDKGGNPLKRAHHTACKKANITSFRVHDWRHHWASHMVMSGCDLYTLMRLGGWSSLAMVQWYAAVSIDHMAQAISRIA